jgi:hypothetical protein
MTTAMDQATQARYAEVAAKIAAGWTRLPVADHIYAETLLHEGRAERRVEPIMVGEHIRGSRTYYRGA